jgi:hypothetical protein
MPDHVIDTNVLLVASAAHPYSPFDDTHVPASERQTVLNWLVAFRNDSNRTLVLDGVFRIYDEYRHKMTEQDLGLLVIHDKMAGSRFRQVDIEYEADGTAVVPEDFADLDRSDRKFLATALADHSHSTIVNATDSDWFAIEDACAQHGVVVEQLIEEWLRGEEP